MLQVINSTSLRSWVKEGHGIMPGILRSVYWAIKDFNAPVIPIVHSVLLLLHNSVCSFVGNFLRMLYWTPLFKSRCLGTGQNLYLYGGMPLVTGPLQIRLGKQCRISAHSTFSGRASNTGSKEQQPTLEIGNNIDIGWQTTIAVGSRIILGDNVRIAGRCFLAGYPGHPEDPKLRAAGQPDLVEQIGDIRLEDNVWLATGVSVMSGVTIGANTIVAAGSVVTKSLPPNVVAGGNPARALRPIRESSGQKGFQVMQKGGEV